MKRPDTICSCGEAKASTLPRCKACNTKYMKYYRDRKKLIAQGLVAPMAKFSEIQDAANQPHPRYKMITIKEYKTAQMVGMKDPRIEYCIAFGEPEEVQIAAVKDFRDTLPINVANWKAEQAEKYA